MRNWSWSLLSLAVINSGFSAANVIDQEVTAESRRGYCTIALAQPIAQEFVPRCAAQARLELYLKSLNDDAPAGAVSVRVLQVDGDDDLDESDVLVGETEPVVPTLGPGQAGWVTLQYSSQLTLVPGITYALAFLTDTPRWAIAFSVDDDYPPDRYRDGWRVTTGDYVFRTLCTTAAHLTGDLNCDGQINAFDIDPFVLALTDPDAYARAYPGCDAMTADINGDGVVNAFDIDPFVALLAGT